MPLSGERKRVSHLPKGMKTVTGGQTWHTQLVWATTLPIPTSLCSGFLSRSIRLERLTSGLVCS